MPWLLAKLWSVIPRLFAWPPVTSAAQAIERATIALLVASTIFLFATGIANIQYWYVFDFDFVQAHYYAAVVFVAALGVHLVVKLPVALRSLRGPEPRDSPLVAVAPDAPALSRRALLAAVGGGSAALLVANAGESVGGPLRRIAFLAPRRDGGFPVNKTAAGAEGHRGDDGAGLPARARGRERRRGRAVARGAARAPPGHPHAHARLRRGLVDAAGVDGRPAARARPPRRRAGPVAAHGRLAAAEGDPAPGDARGEPGRRLPLAARAEGRRRGPRRPTTATRRGSSSPACPACTTPSGSAGMEFRA